VRERVGELRVRAHDDGDLQPELLVDRLRELRGVLRRRCGPTPEDDVARSGCSHHLAMTERATELAQGRHPTCSSADVIPAQDAT